jgi:hypothetical protein
MNFPMYRHTVTVSEGGVSPVGPLECGTQGDHLAARLTFEPLDSDAGYGVEVVTAYGEVLDVPPTTPRTGRLEVDVPREWTGGGLATVRLYEVHADSATEFARRYFPPVTLRFAGRQEGVRG